jgi:hypothetical protein
MLVGKKVGGVRGGSTHLTFSGEIAGSH